MPWVAQTLVTTEGRICTKCAIYKPWQEFKRDKRSKLGRAPSCKTCCWLEAREYYQRNKPRITARTHAFNRTEHRRSYIRNYRREELRRERERLASRPRPQCCEACGETNKAIVFDHDHKSGEFRGWLCHRCNRVIGMAGDAPSTLRAMASYLESPCLGPR